MTRFLFVMTGTMMGMSLAVMLLGLLYIWGGSEELKVVGLLLFAGFGYALGTCATVWFEMRQHQRWMRNAEGWFDR